MQGLAPPRVRELLQAALARLEVRATATFTRADLREALARAGAPADALQGLEAAFFRAVAPLSVERGRYELSEDAELLIRHREHRLPAVRLDLASTLQLNRILRQARGEELTPKLRDQLERGLALEHQLRHRG